MAREVRKPGELMTMEDVRQVELLLNKYGCGVWLYNSETAELEYTATDGELRNPVGDLKVMTLAEALRLVLDIIDSTKKSYDNDIEKMERLLGSYQQTWQMWVLSAGDIESKWSEMYPDAPKLTEDQMDDVAMAFRDVFEDAQDNWSEILQETIEDEIPKPEEV